MTGMPCICRASLIRRRRMRPVGATVRYPKSSWLITWANRLWAAGADAVPADGLDVCGIVGEREGIRREVPVEEPSVRRIAIAVRRLSGRGGMETVIRTVIHTARFARVPTAMEVWCFGPPEQDEWLRDVPHRVVRIDRGPHRRFQLATKLPCYQGAMRRLVRDYQPDVVVATDPIFVRAARTWRNSSSGQPRVYSWVHFPLDRLANVRWLGRADGHLAVSRDLARQLAAVDPVHVPTVVGNPLPNTVYPLLPQPVGVPRLVYIGRIANRQKRIDLLFSALSRLRPHAWTLDIVGDGPDRPMLQRLAAHLRIGHRLTWHGWQPRPWSVLEYGSLLVLTSAFEGFAMVLAEGLARGLPVLATDCIAGPRDIVQPGANGWLVRPGRVDPLVDVLKTFWSSGDSTLSMSAADRQADILARFGAPAVWGRIDDALMI